jgi:large subunit ribosomal protein L24
MKNKLKIRRDDTVVVIAGKHKGKIGKVVRVMPLDSKVVVEGVAMVKRHVKAQGQQAGSIVEKEAAIHVSNVALWNAAEGRRVKVGFAVDSEGTKVRVDRKTGASV